jgi:hypothetical protein
VNFKDGTVRTYQVLEISEVKRRLVFEWESIGGGYTGATATITLRYTQYDHVYDDY